MRNESRHKKNQPPTVVGTRQPRVRDPTAVKRSEVAQAARYHPELNVVTSDEEAALRAPRRKPPKAGR